MEELRQVAYVVATTEPWIAHILPPERVNNMYSQSNSSSASSASGFVEPWGEWGSDWASHVPELSKIWRSIGTRRNQKQLCRYIQGSNKYTMWNFLHTLEGRKGTIEFRGGRHLRGPVITKRWIVFTVAFVALAIEKVTDSFTTTLIWTYANWK